MPPSAATRKFAPFVLLTGLLAGTLDASAAILNYIIPNVRNPVVIFQYIASGLFGLNAFSGGAWMPILGLIFHYIIATGWTVLFFLVYPRINWIGKNKVVAGLSYGIFVWLAMNLVVIPLSRVPKFPFNFTQAAIGMVILMLAIGLPISLRAHRYYSGS